MRLPVGTWAALGLVTIAGACDAGLSGFSNGAPPSDGGVAETPADGAATPADAGGPADSGTSDASSSVRFCEGAGSHALCDDFDGYRDASWGALEQGGGGAIGTASDGFVSPPKALLATTNAAPSGLTPASFAAIARDFQADIVTAHVEADVKSCPISTAGYVAFAYLSGPSTSNQVGTIGFGIRLTTAVETFVFVNHAGATEDYSAGALLPSDRFSRVAFDVRFHPTAGAIKLTVDGTVRLDLPSVPTSNASVTSRSFHIGSYTDGGPACRVLLDNVLVDVAK